VADKNFTHVCAACRTPALIKLERRTGLNLIILAAATVIGGFFLSFLAPSEPWTKLGSAFLLFSIPGGMILGFLCAFTYLRHDLRKKALTCPACHSERLLPVASPEGTRVMKALGFTEA